MSLSMPRRMKYVAAVPRRMRPDGWMTGRPAHRSLRSQKPTQKDGNDSSSEKSFPNSQQLSPMARIFVGWTFGNSFWTPVALSHPGGDTSITFLFQVHTTPGTRFVRPYRIFLTSCRGDRSDRCRTLTISGLSVSGLIPTWRKNDSIVESCSGEKGGKRKATRSEGISRPSNPFHRMT